MVESRRGRGRGGFTLVELLVVIAIIGILVSLLLPAVQAAREAARRMKCSNNLKQYGLAMHNYHDVYNTLPPGGIWEVSAQDWGHPAPSWQARILPFMEQQTIYDKINWNLNVYSNPFRGFDSIVQPATPTTPQRLLRQLTMPWSWCPSDDGEQIESDAWAQSSYSGSLGSQRTPSANGNCNQFLQIAGRHFEALPWNADHGNTWRKEDISGVFCRMGTQGKMSFSTVLDGTSNVIMIGEVLYNCHDHRAGMWHYNGMGNAHSSTSAPINIRTTCTKTGYGAGAYAEAREKGYPFPDCADRHNWNFSWGFKSRHKGGAQFVLVDGSVQMLQENIDYLTYQYLGGRSDGRAISTQF